MEKLLKTAKKITSQEGRFLNFRRPLLKNVLTPLAKSVLIPLGLTAAVSDAAIQKKILGPVMMTLIISNE